MPTAVLTFSGKFGGVSASDSHQMEHQVVEVELAEAMDGQLTGDFAVGFGHQMDDPSTYPWTHSALTGQTTDTGNGTSRMAILQGHMQCHRFEDEVKTVRISWRENSSGRPLRMLEFLSEEGEAQLKLRER